MQKRIIILLLLFTLPVLAEYDMKFSSKISDLIYREQLAEDVDRSLERWKIHIDAAVDGDQPENVDQFLSGVCYLFGVANMFKAARLISNDARGELLHWLLNKDLTVGGPWERHEVQYAEAISFLVKIYRKNEA